MQIYFYLPLITWNVPLQIGKCTPGGTSVFPLSRKKNGTFGTFFGCQPTKILKIDTCIFLDAISFIGESFTIQNFNIFSKMYGTYFHD